MFEIPVSKAPIAPIAPITTSTRILPNSIKKGSNMTIDCALYLPEYIQKPLYDVKIDFDEASKAWRANKNPIGNGEYKYKKQVHFENI